MVVKGGQTQWKLPPGDRFSPRIFCCGDFFLAFLFQIFQFENRARRRVCEIFHERMGIKSLLLSGLWVVILFPQAWASTPPSENGEDPTERLCHAVNQNVTRCIDEAVPTDVLFLVGTFPAWSCVLFSLRGGGN